MIGKVLKQSLLDRKYSRSVSACEILCFLLPVDCFSPLADPAACLPWTYAPFFLTYGILFIQDPSESGQTYGGSQNSLWPRKVT